MKTLTRWERFKFRFLPVTKLDLIEMETRIMATQAEAAQQVRDLTARINKIGTETAATLEKVNALQAIIDAGNGGTVSEELQTAINEAIASAQATDDLTPDAQT